MGANKVLSFSTAATERRPPTATLCTGLEGAAPSVPACVQILICARPDGGVQGQPAGFGPIRWVRPTRLPGPAGRDFAASVKIERVGGRVPAAPMLPKGSCRSVAEQFLSSLGAVSDEIIAGQMPD